MRCGRVRAPSSGDAVKPMLAVQPNSNAATMNAANSSSPFAAVINNATDANGAPVFSQVVRDALNRTTNKEASQPTPTSAAKTADAPAAPQPTAAYSSNVSKLAALPSLTKQPEKTAAQKPSSNTQAAGTLLTAFFSGFSPDLSQQTPGASALEGVAATANESASPTIALGSCKQKPQISDGEDPAALLAVQAQSRVPSQFASQLQGRLGSVLPVATELLTSDAAKSAGASNNEGVSATQSSIARGANEIATALTAALDTALGGAPGLTVSNSTKDAASAGGTAGATASTGNTPTVLAGTSNAASSSSLNDALRTVTNARISASSANPAKGELVSFVVQKITDLVGAGASHLPAPSLTVDIARNAVQSQSAQSGVTSELASSPVLRISPANSALSASETKGGQSASLGAHAALPIQNADSSGNDPSTEQDSSSNHPGQNSTDSSVSADLSSASALLAKAQTSVFSDTLATASLIKPDVATPAQIASAAVPLASTPVSQNDLPARSADLPAQAPAPPTLPASPLPDTAPSRFVNDAQITNAASQSEMRIAMQTEKLGVVELHARVNGDEVGAAILFEKRDAHAALALELPALREALSEKQLRIEQVSLSQGSLSSTGGDAGANTPNGQRGNGQPLRQTPFWNEERSVTTAAWFVPEQGEIFNAQGRLSVQA